MNDTIFITADIFSNIMSCAPFENVVRHNDIAVACSGGADSLALTKLLSDWARDKDINIHALIIDHDLRLESAQEAKDVAKQISHWDNIGAHILKWEGDQSETRIQEHARNARYDLMKNYCSAHNIQSLFLGHHRNDQAETVLFRLAKGSGLDGLAGIKKAHNTGNGLTLYRPLLDMPKSSLIATCEAHNLNYVIDPSNMMSARYARARLRESADILEREGLSAKRLSVTAKRLKRAQDALEYYTDKTYMKCVSRDANSIKIDIGFLENTPYEIGLRVLMRAIKNLRTDADYAPRMERVETLFFDAISEKKFRKRTLGGLVFVVKGKALLIFLEN